MTQISPVQETPKLRGKTVAVYVRHRPATAPVVISDCLFETRGERLFLVGTGVSGQRLSQEWTDGVRRSIAWDAVEEYLLFDSPEDYYTRIEAAPPAVVAEPNGMPATMPMFTMPLSAAGAPVEPSGIPYEPETPLEVGTIVLAFSQEQWWRAEVLGIDADGMVRIHFPGWDSSWDTSVPKTELQVYLGESLEPDA